MNECKADKERMQMDAEKRNIHHCMQYTHFHSCLVHLNVPLGVLVAPAVEQLTHW